MNMQYDDAPHIIVSAVRDNKLESIGTFSDENGAIKAYLHRKEVEEMMDGPDKGLYTFKNTKTGEIKVAIPHLMDSKQLAKYLQDLHDAPFMNETLTSVLEAIERKQGASDANLI